MSKNESHLVFRTRVLHWNWRHAHFTRNSTKSSKRMCQRRQRRTNIASKTWGRSRSENKPYAQPNTRFHGINRKKSHVTTKLFRKNGPIGFKRFYGKRSSNTSLCRTTKLLGSAYESDSWWSNVTDV